MPATAHPSGGSDPIAEVTGSSAASRHAVDRRRFLGGGLGAVLLALHGTAAEADVPRPRETGARLLDLRLETSAALGELAEFYGGLLGLDIVEQAAGSLTLAAGPSRLTFSPTGGGKAPFYHFAFNIPENRVRQARDWQLERTELLAPWERLRDPAYPADVVWFRNWNAHSVFFLDPAGNVVEYIGRHTLDNATAGSFSSRDILYCSEIGLITDDVLDLADRIGATFGIDRYGSGSEAFTALGDEHGLILVMRRGRELAFGRGREAEVFPARVGIRARRAATWTAGDLPYRLDSRSG